MDTGSAIISLLAFAFVYFVIYRRSNFFGHIAYLFLGAGIIISGSTDVDTMIGTFILLASLFNAMLQFIVPKKKRKTNKTSFL